MAAINDLRIALINMGKSDGMDLEQAYKSLRKSRDIAAKYTRANLQVAKRIIFILNDAAQSVQFAKQPETYLRFVASECLELLPSSKPTSE